MVSYGGPVGRAYEQRLESKNWYEPSPSRAKIGMIQEQKWVESEGKNEYEPTALSI